MQPNETSKPVAPAVAAQPQQEEAPAEQTPTVKADMLLSLRNLLNFLASSHIKTGIASSKDAVATPCVAYTSDCACVMVAHDSKASKWDVSRKSKMGEVDPKDVQKGSNVSPDGSKKAIINGEERLIIVDTKTGEQIIGPNLAGYQIMLGKPKLSWSHIMPVWSPNAKQCAIGADSLVVLIDVPHLVEVDSFIKQVNPEQLAVLEKIHTAYSTFDKNGPAKLTAGEKELFNAFPHVVTKALKPYIE